jgi:1-deoxy-D-xylulose-5-phosphate reductoisomerase
MPRNIAVLGSTGSIGRQTLDVAARFPERVRVYGLAANRSTAELRLQAERHAARAVVTGVESARCDLTGAATEILSGEEGMVELVTRPEVDLVVVGTTGRAGLAPTLAALRAGKLVALANKEVLVMAGAVITETLAAGRGTLVPIDSEHSAIWQCLCGESHRAIERLVITASGGALRDLSPEELAGVTPQQALRHPTWSMGPKITVDSATLMNKGLEVIEARWLFDVPQERIEVVLHPQSIVHSLVVFDDSSVKAQLGLPDMRLPIQYALSHPERWSNDLPRLDLPLTGSLNFGPIDLDRYPALQLALEAGRAGGIFPAVLSAADEVAVEAFLAGEIPFTAISDVVAAALDRSPGVAVPSLTDILEADARARQWSRAHIERVRT